MNKLGKNKKPSSAKIQPVKWADLFTCFLCGKEGRSPPLVGGGPHAAGSRARSVCSHWQGPPASVWSRVIFQRWTGVQLHTHADLYASARKIRTPWPWCAYSRRLG